MKQRLFMAMEVDERSVIGKIAHAEKLAEELQRVIRDITREISAEESQPQETGSPQ